MVACTKKTDPPTSCCGLYKKMNPIFFIYMYQLIYFFLNAIAFVSTQKYSLIIIFIKDHSYVILFILFSLLLLKARHPWHTDDAMTDSGLKRFILIDPLETT